MNVSDLVTEFESLGVELWTESEELRFRAPKDVMTGARRQALRSLKAELIEHLRSRRDRTTVSSEPDKRFEPYPLTDVQAAYLVGRTNAFAYGSSACQVYTEIHYVPLDPARLEAAWQKLIARHDMLRTIVHPDGYQQTLPSVPQYRLAVRDLRGTPEPRRREWFESVRKEMDHRTYRTDQWPLFELRLTLEETRSTLHFSMDFIIADYFSIQILLQELSQVYFHPARELPALNVTFRDYLSAERRLRDGSQYMRDRDYWTGRIASLPAAPELPRSSADGNTTGRFRRHSVTLDESEWDALRTAAAANRITPSVVVLASYAEVIGRWSRHAHFCLNLTLLNRQPLHPQVQHLVGDFTTVTLLEVDNRSPRSFAERAKALAEQLFADMDHRQFSGVEVLRQIARQRGRDAALMPVVFTSTIGLPSSSGESHGEFAHGISQTPQLWIDCQAVEDGNRLRLYWDVRDDVLPFDVVDDMFASWVRLLELLRTEPDAWQRTDVISLPSEQQARRDRANATSSPLPTTNLLEPVLAQAQRTKGRTAVIAGDVALTYRDLIRRASGVAQALIQSGCSARSVVAVVMDKGWEQVVAVLGAMMAGAAYLPIDTNQPRARRDQILRDANAKHVLCQSWLAADREHFPEAVQLISVDELSAPRETPDSPIRDSDPDDLAYVIYTSGSTGTPKGVMMSHRSALNTITDVNRMLGLTEDDCVLGLANLGFDLSVFDIFGTLSVGGCLVLPDATRRNDPSHWYDLVNQHRVTVWNSVPAQLQMLQHFLDSEPAAVLDSLRVALLSGDWIPVALPDAIRSRAPRCRLVSLGGATEAAIWSIYYPIEEVPKDWRSIPYGMPLANQSFHVLNHALEPCPDYCIGELYIGGAGLALGYWNDPERTQDRFVRHPRTGERLYRTGDLGRYLGDGNIEFLGREDRQVKIRGHRIELAEVEAVLASHEAVGAAAALVEGEGFETRRLFAFAETARTAAQSHRISSNGLANAARTAAEEVRAGFAAEKFVQFVRNLDLCALHAMLQAFRKAGLFSNEAEAWTADDILRLAAVAPKHQRLIRGWLNVLTAEQFLRRDASSGRYQLARQVPVDSWEAAWASVDDPEFEIGFSKELLDYMRVSQRHLLELMQDKVGAVQLVFPEGRVELWEATYRNNLLSRYVNRAVVAVLDEIAAARNALGKLKVLEVGAGVGGITEELVPALRHRDVDYLFTDVSQLFLGDGKRRFADYPWVRFGLFDLNQDYRPQGLEPNSFDVIVSAHVMHYSKHVGRSLGRLRELLAPGGWLVFVDMTQEGYQIMTSMMFLGGAQADFEDMRHGRDRTFVTRAEWLEALSAAGGELVLSLPGEADAFTPLGQQVFAARFKQDREEVEPADLDRHVRERLPEYMVPAHIQIVDALPLTDNGKIDVRTLRTWLPRIGGSSETIGTNERFTDDDCQSELETRLAKLCAQLLGLERVGRTQNFFDMGGDSLLAARLVGRIREEFPEARGLFWDNLVRQFLPDPTVAALATFLAAGTASEPSTESPSLELESPLVKLGGDAAGVPLVCVHDSSGELGAYTALIPHLEKRATVMGLRVVDQATFLTREPASIFEVFAADFAKVLKQEYPDGCSLVGFHSGGVMALEVARQLLEMGGTVVDLKVISSYPIPCLVEDDLLLEYLFARGVGIDPVEVGFPKEAEVGAAINRILHSSPDLVAQGASCDVSGGQGLDQVGRAFRKLAAIPSKDRLQAIARAAHIDSDPARLGERFMSFRHGIQAASRHRPAAYAGDITLIRHLGATPLWPTLRDDMTKYWQDLCLGDLHILDAPGDHFNLVNEPYATRVAELILPPGEWN